VRRVGESFHPDSESIPDFNQAAVISPYNRGSVFKIQLSESMIPQRTTAMHPATNSDDLHERIRRRAEEIYLRGGCIPGRDLENWAQAEKEILEELQPTRRTAIVVEVDGVQYVGEYASASSDGYQPGEINPETPVQLRFEGDKMFLRRANGSELETTIVQRIS
jgi:hypothetical protein